MKNILITGGTLFVSKYLATYYVEKGENVFVLNRGTREQVKGVTLIKSDKNNINGALKDYKFDVIIAVNIYNESEMSHLLSELTYIDKFIFISSSAVYPESTPLPFQETAPTGYNSIWQDYGLNKIAAENCLLEKVPNAYIIRPPYLYGKMQNLYREGFIFDCAEKGLPFYMPNNGDMFLHFYNVLDLCLFIDKLLKFNPKDNIFNVGNKQLVTVAELVEICYEIVGTQLVEVYIEDDTHEQRNYFPFHDYEYYLALEKQSQLMPETIPLYNGLILSYNWYKYHENEVIKKPYLDYIEKHFSFE